MRLLRPLCPLVLLLLLVGCGASDPSSSEPTPDPSASSPTATPDPAPPAQSSGSSAPPSTGGAEVDFTDPGSRFALDDTATVDLLTYQGESAGSATVTVSSIEQFPAEEFEAAGGDRNGDALWLIRASLEVTEVTEVPGGLMSVYPTVDLTGESDGRPLPKPGADLSRTADCAPTGLDEDTEVGDVIDFCVGAVTVSDQVVSAAWSPSSSDYSYRGGAPIVWDS